MPVAVWLAALLVFATAAAAGMAPPALAADSILLDVSPDDGAGATGDVVTLTADLFDGSGDPLLTDRTIRFYFQAGSANDPGGTGNSPDMTCDTGTHVYSA